MDNRRQPGDEIPRELYERAEAEAREAGTLRSLSRAGALHALEDLNRPIHDGYMVDDGGGKYVGYGWTNYQQGARQNYKFYFLGEVAEDPKLNGVYYFFDCMNAFINDGYFRAEDFADEEEAIQTGANYEADIYKVIMVDGEETGRTLLYTPHEGRTIAEV